MIAIINLFFVNVFLILKCFAISLRTFLILIQVLIFELFVEPKLYLMLKILFDKVLYNL